MRSWLELDHRNFPIVRSRDHGLSLMRGAVRLRIDRERRTAALVGEVCEVVDEPNGDVRAFSSIWTPVPIEIALDMARVLHQMQEGTVGDSAGGRIGWRDAGYDGEVADWYCHKQ